MKNFKKRFMFVATLLASLAMHVIVLKIYNGYELDIGALTRGLTGGDTMILINASAQFDHAFEVLRGIAMFLGSYLIPALLVAFVMYGFKVSTQQQ
jgi:hypothetical protein